MTAPALVDALWNGPPALLDDGTPLDPGRTIVQIPRVEAEQSDHWTPLEAPVEDDD